MKRHLAKSFARRAFQPVGFAEPVMLCGFGDAGDRLLPWFRFSPGASAATCLRRKTPPHQGFSQ